MYICSFFYGLKERVTTWIIKIYIRTEMFFPKSCSQISYFWTYFFCSISHKNSFQHFSLKQQTQLWISTTSHRSVIDICWSYNKLSIINNHDFTMRINNFSGRFSLKNSMSSQPKERDIVMRIDSLSLQSLKQTHLWPTNSIILPM